MGRKRHTAEQGIRKLREAEVELSKVSQAVGNPPLELFVRVVSAADRHHSSV